MDSLIRFTLERAKEDLDYAIKCIEENNLRFAVDRAYYTIYHSIRAILFLEQKDLKEESELIAYFNQHYINTNLFPSDLYNLISDVQRIRNLHNYDDLYTVSVYETEKQVENAKLIYDSIEKYIKSQE